MTLKNDEKSEQELTCRYQLTNCGYLANSRQSTRKSQNRDIDGILLSKVESV